MYFGSGWVTPSARRREGWAPNPPRYTSGVLAKFAKMVQGAEKGAVTNVRL